MTQPYNPQFSGVSLLTAVTCILLSAAYGFVKRRFCKSEAQVPYDNVSSDQGTKWPRLQTFLASPSVKILSICQIN